MIGPRDDFPALNFDQKEGERVSPIVHVTSDDAPTLLVHGTKDRLVPLRHSEQMKAALDARDVPCELLIIEGAGHGFGSKAADQAVAASIQWFDRCLNSGRH
jgi:dipeptidyl aminopeptidase/acylaminoacyl peptidase